MKTFIKILVLLGFLVLAFQCKKSTEEKIIEKIKFAGIYDRAKIVKLDIIDTIYQKDIELKLKIDTMRLEYLKERYDVFSSKRDSIRRTPRPQHIDTIKMKEIKSIFDSLMVYERWIEIVDRQSDYYERLYAFYYNPNDIRGYRVIIHHKDGRTNDLIIEDDYRVLCPSFMLEPIDSLIKFRPNEYRKRPQRPTIRRGEFQIPKSDFGRPNN